jgi:hypothetical protein
MREWEQSAQTYSLADLTAELLVTSFLWFSEDDAPEKSYLTGVVTGFDPQRFWIQILPFDADITYEVTCRALSEWEDLLGGAYFRTLTGELYRLTEYA